MGTGGGDWDYVIDFKQYVVFNELMKWNYAMKYDTKRRTSFRGKWYEWETAFLNTKLDEMYIRLSLGIEGHIESTCSSQVDEGAIEAVPETIVQGKK